MAGAGKLISGSVWNIAGQVVPLGVAVVAIPWLIRLIGLERFGFISLAWILVGYASVLDLGIARALTRTVSSKLFADDMVGANSSGRTGMTFLLCLGVFGGGLIAIFGPLLVDRVLVVSSVLKGEALEGIYLLALSLPFVMLINGYIGILTAHQDFQSLNLIRIVFGALSYFLPVVVALLGFVSLGAVIGTILFLRAVSTFVYMEVIRRRTEFIWRPSWPNRSESEELLALGGWMSVTNIVNPLLIYLDRLLVGSLVPLKMVGIYSAPYDLIIRLLLLPYAVVAAFFPMAAAIDPKTQEARRALSNICRYLYVFSFPVFFVAMGLAHPAMVLWLGREMGSRAANILQILTVGVLLCALAQGASTLIQAAGRPSHMAILQLVELPIFLAALWVLTNRWGIEGTAIAASLRFGLDAIAVFVIAERNLVGEGERFRWSGSALPVAAAGVLLACASTCRAWPSAIAIVGVGLTAFGLYAWFGVLNGDERARIGVWLRLRWV